MSIFVLSVLAATAARADGYLSDGSGVSGDLFGSALSELEDVNADGRWEFLVGVPGALTLDGEVHLWYGGTGLGVVPSLTWTGAGNEQFGWAVARIGDVNNGGKADFAVGAPFYDSSGLDRGRLYVFYGENLGAGTAAAQADVILAGENGGDRFGWSVSAAGDFDGDGRDDFMVGAPRNDASGLDAGAAYVIYGASGGPSTDLADATKLTGEVAGDAFGWAVSDAGNFLAGNEDCVAVGAPLNGSRVGLGAGAVYVFEGALGGATPNTTADFVAGIGAASTLNAQYGYAVRNAGRWNADSWDDLAIGAPTCSQGAAEAGRVEIIFGASSPTTSGDRSVGGVSAGDHLGWALARAHDYQGVGGTSAEDLLIGAPGWSQGATAAGRAYVYRGGQATQATAAGLDLLANIPLMSGTTADDQYGGAVGSLGDFDGDGDWDVAVGAPGGNAFPTSATAGFVHLLHSSAGPVAAAMQAWDARWVTTDDRGQVALSFRLAEPAVNIAAIELTRRTTDAHGRDVAVATLWTGAAVPSPAAVGQLACDGQNYAFTDPGPAAPPSGGSLSYALSARTGDGRTLALGDLAGPVGTAPDFGLAVAAFPNPGGADLRLSFRARAGEAVIVDVFDLRGRLVRHLFSGSGNGAWMDAAWDGRDETGRAVAGGVYFLSAQSREGSRSRRLTLLR